MRTLVLVISTLLVAFTNGLCPHGRLNMQLNDANPHETLAHPHEILADNYVSGNDHMAGIAGNDRIPEPGTATQKWLAVLKLIRQGGDKPAKWYSFFRVLGIFVENLSVSFTRASDVMPAGRKKLIHSQGVVAPIRWYPVPGHGYSGIFQHGSNFGILRASLATAPAASETGKEGDMNPAIAFKIFNDNFVSSNFFAMYSLDGQKGFNFFENTLTNHVPEPNAANLKLLAKRFRQVSKYSEKSGIHDLGYGSSLGNLKIPYRLEFVPSKVIKERIARTVGDYRGENWIKQFKLIVENEQIYDVYAYEHCDDQNPTLVGGITLLEKFQTSTFGDTDLFFQHAYFDKDIESYKRNGQRWECE